MMTDILQQKHDTVNRVQQITRLLEERVYDIHQVQHITGMTQRIVYGCYCCTMHFDNT
jgi:hypothetical protein